MGKMQLDLERFTPAERATLRLRGLYEKAGYRKFRMSRFEDYALYQENESFLPDARVITFTDLDGHLRALKPDVTLSIAKNAQPARGECKKYYYTENVYRPSRESGTFAEISQMGLECIGTLTPEVQSEVLALALQSLSALGMPFVLELSHMGFVTGLLDAIGVPGPVRPGLLALLRDKNAHELRTAAGKAGLKERDAEALCALLELHGRPDTVFAAARLLCRCPAQEQALRELEELTGALHGAGADIRLDLSLSGDMEYYNGLVFTGYLAGVPRAVLKGGRYDPLARKFTPGVNAVGFAVYLDELARLESPIPPVQRGVGADGRVWLNIALPKGRLGDKAYALLAAAGCGGTADLNATRRLVIADEKAGIRYFLVKPSDVAIYVEHGAADIGIVGKDILTESGADVYELMDTGLGRCRMCVAAPRDFTDDESRPLRVATKFVNIARAHYERRGRDIDIIKLNGSIELAPILGLSDVIVDIVETGTTLKENDLAVVEEFMPISARFIANKASYKFKYDKLNRLLKNMREALTK
jgi:ATP phosphoribosyltransferase regulatory subunit